MEFKLMYPGFLPKAVTCSYDDGVIQDLKLIPIMNKYHLKGTFNLNSGKAESEKFRDGKYQKNIDCSHLNLKEVKDCYQGHEIATHTKNHPFLEKLTKAEQEKEFKDDIVELEHIFNTKIHGAAYPYGTYNKETLEVEEKLNIEYSRTVKSTYSFHRPYNFLLWHPTIHHRDPLLDKYVDFFFQTDEELALFYLWGHAYEYALDDNFEVMEKFGKRMDEHPEVYKGTNYEICSYIKAAELVYYKKREEGFFVNPSDQTVYLVTERGDKLVLKPRERIKYE